MDRLSKLIQPQKPYLNFCRHDEVENQESSILLPNELDAVMSDAVMSFQAVLPDVYKDLNINTLHFKEVVKMVKNCCEAERAEKYPKKGSDG